MYFYSKQLTSVLSGLFLLLLFQMTVHGNMAIDEMESKESQGLEKLRPLLADDLYQDYMKTDNYLLRWLRHFDFNVNRTAERLKLNHIWRKENNIDSILKKDMSKYEKLFPNGFVSVDKEGRPVWSFNFGKWDIRKIVLAGQIDEFKTYTHYMYENMEHKIRELDAKNTEKNITQIMTITDLKGFSARQHSCLGCLPAVIYYATVFENYYAGLLFKGILINAPASFEAFYDVIKPFLSAKSQNSLTILGYDKERWQAELLKHIAPEKLPIKFGGNKPTKME